IQEVIDLLIGTAPIPPLKDTVDTVKTGDPSQPLKGIVSAMFATVDVVQKAIDRGANFIVAHEPTFYNHADETDWLSNDPVHQQKLRLLDRHAIVVFRFHDYWHRYKPDGILQGVLRQLEWQDYVHEDETVTIPETTLAELVARVKRRMQVPAVRVIGDSSMICRRVGLLPGAWGGRRQISTIGRDDVDVLICGEVNEWETPEYVRDAVALGQDKGLIVTGHYASEEAGMRWLAEWLRLRLPDVAIHHVPSRDPFRYA
ncbi:MAG: Nif3-like dinuclear metal center hexameric protein, partial [Bacteroidota bacterium]